MPVTQIDTQLTFLNGANQLTNAITSLNTENVDGYIRLTTKSGKDAGKLEYLPSPDGITRRWVFSHPQVFCIGKAYARLGYSQHSSYRKLAAAEYAALAWAMDNLDD